ncbi:MAG: hypothetical protein M0C28_13615, partial [Candidatus Moduliflexus flocculans]|nr:hypothetical protein [Candidatus Moduliflexus flocculans]
AAAKAASPRGRPSSLLSDAIRGGVTTVVGLPGHRRRDAHAWPACSRRRKALDEEGLSTFIYTGHYAVPVQTLTGSIERDLLLIDKVDRRRRSGAVGPPVERSPPSTSSPASPPRRGAAASCRARPAWSTCTWATGGAASSLLRRIIEETEIPVTQFLPTHIGRNPSLFEEGIAYAKAGGLVDFTTSTVPAFLDEGEVKCSAGLRRMLDAGVDAANITFTSDGQGSLPDFDAHGRLRRLEIGRVDEPVRRGAGRGARRGRAARHGARRSSRRTRRAS